MFLIKNNNYFLTSKYGYPLIQHERKSHHKKKPKTAVTDVGSRRDERPTRSNKKNTNDRHKRVLKDGNIHNHHTQVTLENETTRERRKTKRKHHRKVKRKHDKGKDLSRTHGGLALEFNGVNINDQMQESTFTEDVGERNNDSSRAKQERTAGATSDKNQSQTQPVTDQKEPTEPILEYADEPLLPLAEACAPLKDILHDMDFYVKMALDETPEEPLDKLTVDESAAIRLYTIEWSGGHRSLYSMLNYTLKTQDREFLRPYFRYMKLLLTALVKLPCVPPCTVWRGVTKNLSAEFPPGTPVTWWAFSSCTTELSVLENNMYLGDTGSRTLFSVEVINGRTIRAHSHFVTEDELLLVPGTYMVVQSLFSPATDMYIIHLKQEIPEELLLAPPFEGIFLSYLVIYFKRKYFYT
jgi:hypothetical protein